MVAMINRVFVLSLMLSCALAAVGATGNDLPIHGHHRRSMRLLGLHPKQVATPPQPVAAVARESVSSVTKAQEAAVVSLANELAGPDAAAISIDEATAAPVSDTTASPLTVATAPASVTHNAAETVATQLRNQLAELRQTRANVVALQATLVANAQLLRESTVLRHTVLSKQDKAAAAHEVQETEKLVRNAEAMEREGKKMAMDTARAAQQQAELARVAADQLAAEAKAQLKALMSPGETAGPASATPQRSKASIDTSMSRQSGLGGAEQTSDDNGSTDDDK